MMLEFPPMLLIKRATRLQIMMDTAARGQHSLGVTQSASTTTHSDMPISTKISLWQGGVILLIGANELIRSFYADYYENPNVIITPILVLVLTVAWLGNLAALYYDALNKRRVPLWCKLLESIIGIALVLFFTGMAKFVL